MTAMDFVYALCLFYIGGRKRDRAFSKASLEAEAKRDKEEKEKVE